MAHQLRRQKASGSFHFPLSTLPQAADLRTGGAERAISKDVIIERSARAPSVSRVKQANGICAPFIAFIYKKLLTLTFS